MNLLMIEDDVFLANKIKEIFEKKVIINRIKILNNFNDFSKELYLINSYDIILVDILLGRNIEKNGIDIVKQIRYKNKVVPIVMISGLNDILWLRLAFDNGASDYVFKPFRFAELEVRVMKWFNKFLSNGNNIDLKFIEYGFLKYEFSRNIFLYYGIEIKLTKLNKYILLLFISKKEELLSDLYLIEKIWGDTNIIDRNLRVTISRLKKHLSSYGINGYIHNIRGEGYILKK